MIATKILCLFVAVLAASTIGNGRTVTENPLQAKAGAPCPADVVFIIESSEKVGKIRFEQIKKNVLEMVRNMLMAQPNTHIALGHFSSNDHRTSVLFNLDWYNNYGQIEQAINGLSYLPILGICDLYAGVELAVNNILVSPHDRPDAPNYVVFFAEGFYDQAANCCPDPRPQAALLRTKSDVFAVATPPDIKLDILNDICGDPNNVVDMNSYNQITDEIHKRAGNCEGPSTFTPIPPGKCNLDLAMVVDSSSRVGSEHFDLVKKYLISLTQRFTIGTNSDQFSMVTYNDYAKVEFPLNKYENREDLESGINSVVFTTGITNTNEALKAVGSTVFKQENGDRSDSPDVVFIITDGHHSESTSDPGPTAQQLRDQGVYLICVGMHCEGGICDIQDYEELVKICGHRDLVLNVSSYEDLPRTIRQVMDRLPCGGTTHTPHKFSTPPITHTTPHHMTTTHTPHRITTTHTPHHITTTLPNNCGADVTFIIETSEMVGAAGLAKVKVAVLDIIKGLFNEPSDTHYALAHYSSPGPKSGVLFGLDWYNDYYSIADVVNGIKYEDVVGISDLYLGLELATNQILVHPSDRAANPNFVILFSQGFYDDAPNCCPNPLHQAELLRKKAHVYAVELGPYTRSSVLADITGSMSRVFTLDSVQHLADQIRGHLGPECGAPPTPPPTASTTVKRELEPLDCTFAVDISQSVGPHNFEQVKWFMYSIIERFTVDPLMSQFGVVTYNDDAKNEIDLNTYSTISDLIVGIFNIPYTTGVTNTYSGLKLILDNLMYHNHGDRLKVNEIVIIVTDGAHTPGTPDPVAVANELRNTFGVVLLCVGIPGSRHDQNYDFEYEELVLLCGSKDRVFNASAYWDLVYLVNGVINQFPTARPITHVTKTTTAAPTDCGSDLAFIVETSQAVGATTIIQVKAAIKQIISILMSRYTTHTDVALAHFSSPDDRSNLLFNLDTYHTLTDILKAVDYLDHVKYGPNSDIYVGLELAINSVYVSPQDRANDPNFVVMFAQGFYDNDPNCCPDPRPAATQLRQKAQIYAVSIGPNVNNDILSDITGSPAKVYSLDDYEHVAYAIHDQLTNCRDSD